MFLLEGQDACLVLFVRGCGRWTGRDCPGPAGSWAPAALHPQVSVQKSPAPAVQRDPRAATLGVCQEDDNSSEGN